MALKWLRRHQKRVMYPLAAIVILSFVFLWGRGNKDGGGGRNDGTVAVVEGRSISGQEYARYSRILTRLRYSQLGVAIDSLAPFRYQIRAEAARRAGIKIGDDQLRDIIKGIISSPMWLDTDDFTEREYVGALMEHKISAIDFEKVLEDVLLAQALADSAVSGSYVTEQERYLAFCRERDQIKIKTKDFEVKDFEKDVEELTDEDLQAYYDRHKDDPHGQELALSTDPEAAVEYGFIDKQSAVTLVKAFRKAEPVAHLEELLAGPFGGLAAEANALALVAAHEKSLLEKYDREKKRRYVIAPKKDEAAAEKTEGEEAEKEQEEAQYRPFQEVRAELEREMDDLDGRSAASRQVDGAYDLMQDWAALRPVGADVFLAGLIGAPLPALNGVSGIADAVEFGSACSRLDAVHGVTPRKKADDLKHVPKLGDFYNTGASATASAGRSPIYSAQAGAVVDNGGIVWRVADYLAPRTLTFDEAKDVVKERVVHLRATKLAFEASMDFRDKLAEGEAGVSGMEDGKLASVRSSRMRPFGGLAVGEVPETPVAINKKFDSPVNDSPSRPEDLVRHETGKYRVGVVVERKAPTMEEFKGDERWLERNEPRQSMIRGYFLVDHCYERINRDAEYEPTTEFLESERERQKLRGGGG